jgi:hypothetical protein
MTLLATKKIRTTIGKNDVLLPREQIAVLLAIEPEDFDLLVAHEIFPGPSDGNLWSRDRIQARHATLLKANTCRGLVYVIGFGPFVKIGFTGLHTVRARISHMQPSCPEPLEVYGEFEGTLFDEIRLLGHFVQHRTIGEWHRREGDLAEWIEQGCPAL